MQLLLLLLLVVVATVCFANPIGFGTNLGVDVADPNNPVISSGLGLGLGGLGTFGTGSSLSAGTKGFQTGLFGGQLSRPFGQPAQQFGQFGRKKRDDMKALDEKMRDDKKKSSEESVETVVMDIKEAEKEKKSDVVVTKKMEEILTTTELPKILPSTDEKTLHADDAIVVEHSGDGHELVESKQRREVEGSGMAPILHDPPKQSRREAVHEGSGMEPILHVLHKREAVLEGSGIEPILPKVRRDSMLEGSGLEPMLISPKRRRDMHEGSGHEMILHDNVIPLIKDEKSSEEKHDELTTTAAALSAAVDLKAIPAPEKQI